jgi:hypothetical protein
VARRKAHRQTAAIRWPALQRAARRPADGRDQAKLRKWESWRKISAKARPVPS